MSRIGKKQMVLPPGVDATILGNTISVKGPKGEFSRVFPESISVSLADRTLNVNPKVSGDSEVIPLWGTIAAHIANMVEGVTRGFEKKLLVEGIGYKVEQKGDKLVFALGLSHLVEVDVPKGINIKVEKNLISISGVNKEEIGRFAAHLRSLKEPEPYKGKGIRYEGEVVKIKQGKKSVT